jgi:hypothetical protein
VRCLVRVTVIIIVVLERVSITNIFSSCTLQMDLNSRIEYLYITSGFSMLPQGADPPPLILHEGRQVETTELRKLPLPPPTGRRAIQPNHIKIRTCSALVPM